MWRRIALATVLLVTLTFPAGCWDQREVEQLGIVLATAVDKGHGGQLEVHVQVVVPRALAGGGMGGMGGGGMTIRPYRHYSATGATVFEAMRQLSMEAPRRLFYAHNQVILIGEDLAREGLGEVLDFFDRSTQIRRHIWLLITKHGQVHEVLMAPSPLELIPAQRLVGIIRERSLSSRFAPQRLGDFVEMLEAKGQEPFTALAALVPTRVEKGKGPGGGQEAGGREGDRGVPEFAAEPPADIRLSGAAVFLGDRMVGALDERETRGLLWVRGEVRGGSMTV
ncbi:MAG: Ger(x)C family spore germination protein, partial [Desulfotomaculales bacterium]